MPQQLALHMEERCCLPVLYMSAWLLTGFASSFPLPFASRVMDVLLTDSYSEPTMKVGPSCMGKPFNHVAYITPCMCQASTSHQNSDVECLMPEALSI